MGEQIEASEWVVSVFGSSAPLEGSEDYELAYRTGRLLAEAGAAVQTGGYGGVMEAASRGAHEAGGHAIGITCEAIEAFRPGGANAFVTREVGYPTLRERLLHLIEHCDAALVLPGGPGTMAEFALLWNLVLVGELAPRPIVLVGDLWARTMGTFVDPRYMHPGGAELIRSVGTAEEGVASVIHALNSR